MKMQQINIQASYNHHQRLILCTRFNYGNKNGGADIDVAVVVYEENGYGSSVIGEWKLRWRHIKMK